MNFNQESPHKPAIGSRYESVAPWWWRLPTQSGMFQPTGVSTTQSQEPIKAPSIASPHDPIVPLSHRNAVAPIGAPMHPGGVSPPQHNVVIGSYPPMYGHARDGGPTAVPRTPPSSVNSGLPSPPSPQSPPMSQSHLLSSQTMLHHHHKVVRASNPPVMSYREVAALNAPVNKSPVSPSMRKAPTRTTNKIVCISNIPWDVTTKELASWLEPVQVPEFGIHILMDRCTENGGKSLGKTLSDAYVELQNDADAQSVVQRLNRTFLKSRMVTIRPSSEQELLQRLFPTLYQDSLDKMDHQTPNGTIYLKRDEINAILMVCKNYKLHFSRKCADRPYENIVSIIRKIKWESSTMAPSAMHRDHVFELMKLAIDILQMHLQKDYHHVSGDMLERLVRVGLQCRGFTERQKQVLCQVAQMDCPQDLLDCMSMPSSLLTATGIPSDVPSPPQEDSNGIRELSQDILQSLSTNTSHERDTHMVSPVKKPPVKKVTTAPPGYPSVQDELAQLQKRIQELQLFLKK